MKSGKPRETGLEVARRGLARVLSRPLAAWEYYFRPELRDPFGGPFNAQRGRQEIFEELTRRLPLQGIVETGTFRGSTTEFVASRSILPVWTVEARRRFHHFARMRLSGQRTVKASLGDSRGFLQQLADDRTVPKRGMFFYLDAHWYASLPLKDEVALIMRHWSDVAIMVDDFEVPDDPGYAFDDYGPGQRLCLDYLAPIGQFGLEAFFPRLSSQDETGSRRGCVVLADAPAARLLDDAATLRRISASR